MLTMTPPPAIELVGIDKRFGAVHANRNIDLSVARGSIHGIVGENGAGKSTLMSILYGFYQADAGTLLINGKPTVIRDSQAAIAAGIGMVHQHFMLVETFTVLENLMLGAEGGPSLTSSSSKARTTLSKLVSTYGLDVDPDITVGRLSVGSQQRVEILKAIYRGAEILILDEPTGVLTPAEADHLFGILRTLRDEGKTVILITHKLREIMTITDTVSVMRRGEIVATRRTVDTSPEELAELMVGRRVVMQVNKEGASTGKVVLSVRNLTVCDHRGVNVVDDVSFDVRAGEIVGIAGVAGNGQSELLEAIAGIRSPRSGEILISDRRIKGMNPAQLRDYGLGHIPEDRHHTGLVLSFEASFNAVLGYHRDSQCGLGPFLSPKRIRRAAAAVAQRYDVRPPDVRLKTANFSGGNQQKIVVAREVEKHPKVLLVGQPTRGVDVGAIEYIHSRLIETRDSGTGLLLVTVELDEIRSLSDRILVMFAGRIVGEQNPQATEQSLGLMMAGIAA